MTAMKMVQKNYFMLQKNYYNAYGSFFPASSVISGRVNLFSQDKQEWIDYFGTENEVDRIYVLGNSASVISVRLLPL